MKKTKIFGGIVVALIVVLLITKCVLENRYYTDMEHMAVCFPSLDGIERGFWKDGYSDTSILAFIGPNDYRVEGFLILSDDKTEELLTHYEWHEVEVEFPKERGEIQVDPAITGFSDFTWVYNQEFSEMVMRDEFWMGDVFLDPNNGILYFDVSTY